MNMNIDTTHNNPMPQVLLISGEGADNAEIEALIENSPRLLISPLKRSDVKNGLKSENGDILIVNVMRLSEAEIELLSDIRAMIPDMPMIVSSPQLTAEETRRLFKFNIHDWLPKPVSAQDMLDSIFRGIRSRKVYNNRVHAVVSMVGGAGATTIAISMADIAATKLFKKKSVALFDLDFSLGNCSFALNNRNTFNLASGAATPRRVDAEFIRVIQQKHSHGFYLYSFKRPELNSEVNGYELVLRMLDAVSVEHDQTFLDIPYYETEWKDDVLTAVNTCTLVTELNLPALKHTIDMIDRVRALRGASFPVRVLINKWETHLFGQRISRKQVTELFGDVPFFYVPLAKSQIGEAVDRGVPPSDIDQRSKFLRVLSKYMMSLELEEAKK